MSHESIIRYDEKSFFINGKRILFFGGEFHYFRTPPELWEDRIRKMKLGGCNFLSTYVPWNFHEPVEGKMLWTGDRDLGRFLDLCEKYGLYVILKPGPYICAEWDFGGFPDWLLSKDIEMRTYDEKYLEYIKRWFTEIAKVSKKYLITNGGTVILFQIENEYDHYLDMGNVKIPEETAKKYMFRLLEIAKEAGIDVPPFTNEGRLVRGSEIIETRTYYPNIPWIWLWEFNHFDEKIELTKKVQPGKPTLILELQAGWFDQFGQPLCKIGLNVLDSIMRNVLGFGASLLNLYMYAGGTTFPGWNCRGDDSVLPKPIGNTTTFDFGVSPIREWGELETEKYYSSRAISMLMSSFPQLFIETELTFKKAKFTSGGGSLKLLKSVGAVVDKDFSNKAGQLMALARVGREGNLVMVRNLEPKPFDVAVELDGVRLPAEGTFNLPDYTVKLLPVNVKLPGTRWMIKYSTSELLTIEKIGGVPHLFVYGNTGSAGELALIEVNGKKTKAFKYVHSGVKVLDAGGLKVIVLDKELRGRVWDIKGGAVVTTFDYIDQTAHDAKKAAFNILIHSGIEHRNTLFLDAKPKKVAIGGKTVPFKWNAKENSCNFGYELPYDKEKVSSIKWEGNWHYCADISEAMTDYDDSDWKVLPEPVSLEEAEIFGHGYYWYRAEFSVEKVNGTAELTFDSGGMDRMYVYINGKFAWKGIGKGDKNIAPFLKQGKNLLAVRYENAYHTKAHPHEGAIKKYSGIQKPFVLKDAYGNTITIKKFRVKFNLGGIDRGYHTAQFNVSGWKQAPASPAGRPANASPAGTPANAAVAGRLMIDESMGNLVWLRRSFTYGTDKSWEAPLKLTIPSAEERCYIYINGYAIGKYESIGPQTDFYIPETMLKKDNVLAIVLEGPGFHRVLGDSYLPAYIEEPVIEPFYAAKKTEMRIEY